MYIDFASFGCSQLYKVDIWLEMEENMAKNWERCIEMHLAIQSHSHGLEEARILIIFC